MAARRYEPVPRFMAKFDVMPDGCWLWNGELHRKGYAYFRVDKRRVYAHRWAYEHFVGPIPEGMTVDHACHNNDRDCLGGVTCAHRRCVNPAHLDLAERGDNVRRGKGGRLTCKNGHEYTPENTYVRSDGARTCRACQRARQKTDAHHEYMREYARAYRRGERRRS